MVHRIKLQVCFQEAASWICDSQALSRACIVIQSRPTLSWKNLASALISADEMDTRVEIQPQMTTNTLKIRFQEKTCIKWQIFAVAEPQQFTWVLEAESHFL